MLMPTRPVFYIFRSWKRNLRYGDMAYLIRSRDAFGTFNLNFDLKLWEPCELARETHYPSLWPSLDPERRCEPDRAEVTPRIGNRGEEVVVDARQVTANVQANRRAAPTLAKLKPRTGPSG